MFLKSADSYENAKETERDMLTCDENGFAQTKDMPYGIYTVCQTSGWEGRELMKDFDVFISKDGQTYRYPVSYTHLAVYKRQPVVCFANLLNDFLMLSRFLK